MTITNTLSEKTCIPCQGGVPRLDLDTCLQMIKQIPDWQLNEDATRISRRFTFDDFLNALNFTGKIGELAESEFHHPDINVGWGYCQVTFQTHKIRGLHENDFIMAAKVNQLPTTMIL